MPVVTMKQLAQIAREAGHVDLRVIESRRGWVATCSCSFRSARQPDQAHAEQAAADHYVRVAQPIYNRLQASGRVVA